MNETPLVQLLLLFLLCSVKWKYTPLKNMLSFTEYLPGVLIRTEKQTEKPTMFLLALDPILRPPPFFLLLPLFDLFSYCWLELNDHSCSAAAGYGCLCVRACVCESLKAVTSPHLAPAKTSTHTTPGPVPYLPRCAPQSCHFNSNQHQSSKNDRSSMDKLTALAVSGRYPVVSCSTEVTKVWLSQRGTSPWQIYDCKSLQFAKHYWGKVKLEEKNTKAAPGKLADRRVITIMHVTRQNECFWSKYGRKKKLEP